MTKREKKKFVKELIASVTKTILEKIDSTPEHWNGIELRQLIADHFKLAAWTLQEKGNQKRLRDYKNEALVRNLV